MKKVLKIAVIVFCVFMVLSAVFFTANAYRASLFDYNEEGRYFDGVTVHHDSAVIGWSVVAGLFWLMSAVMARHIYKKRDR